MFAKYKHDLQRSDAIRYMLLFHYGGETPHYHLPCTRSVTFLTTGIYMDMDVECVRPLLPGLRRMNSTCVVDQERWEQTHVFHEREFSAMNSVMACTAGHPFFKFLIEGLPQHARSSDTVRSTGPWFMTNRLLEYRKLERYKERTVLVAHPEVFSPYFDDINKLKHFCKYKEHSVSGAALVCGLRLTIGLILLILSK